MQSVSFKLRNQEPGECAVREPITVPQAAFDRMKRECFETLPKEYKENIVFIDVSIEISVYRIRPKIRTISVAMTEDKKVSITPDP